MCVHCMVVLLYKLHNPVPYSGYNLQGTLFATHEISYPAIIFAFIKLGMQTFPIVYKIC